METNYIHTHITPILAYLRSSLQSSLRKPSNLKAIQKMISLRSGVKLIQMDKKEALEIVKKDGEKITSLPENFQKDREVVLEAIKNFPLALHDVSYKHKSLLKDRELVLEAVKNGSSVLFNDDIDKSFLKDMGSK